MKLTACNKCLCILGITLSKKKKIKINKWCTKNLFRDNKKQRWLS